MLNCAKNQLTYLPDLPAGLTILICYTQYNHQPLTLSRLPASLTMLQIYENQPPQHSLQEVSTHLKRFIYEHYQEDQDCPVCTERITKETLFVTPCGHFLCNTCSTQITKYCPICRSSTMPDLPTGIRITIYYDSQESPQHSLQEVSTHLKKFIYEHYQEDQDCPVCIERITKETLFVPPCGHFLCNTCSTQITKYCPICRANNN